MKKATFTFRCRLTGAGIFSAYKGSMLRGSLGTFLRKTCCTIRRQPCNSCALAPHCAFPMLFIGKNAARGGAAFPLPPPYCITAADTEKTFYDRGECFTFDLTLFSYAVGYLPYFVHAITLTGRNGMGRTSDETRGTFEIEDILYQGLSIFNREEQRIAVPEGEDLLLPRWNASAPGFGTLLVTMQTPCRFKADNRLSSDLPFRRLFDLILRRIRALWALDDEAVRFDSFFTMLDRADAVATVENHLFWKDWTRYSSRQKASMQLGGVQGSVRYYGDLATFLPFLEMAKNLHIGKQTSFGLGRITFTWNPDEKDTDSPVR